MSLFVEEVKLAGEVEGKEAKTCERHWKGSGPVLEYGALHIDSDARLEWPLGKLRQPSLRM